MNRQIQIGTTSLLYRNIKNCIITYINEISYTNTSLLLNELINDIFELYRKFELKYSNVCGANTQKLCSFLKTRQYKDIKFGKLIIMDWNRMDKTIVNSIRTLYNGSWYNSHYHALTYLEITVENQIYFVAIETTIDTPYKLYFYLGSDYEEFETIIKTIYQCNSFKTSYDCLESWDSLYFGSIKNEKVETKEVEPKEVETKEVEPKEVETKEGGPKEVETKEVEPKEGGPKEVETKEVEPKEGGPKKGGYLILKNKKKKNTLNNKKKKNTLNNKKKKNTLNNKKKKNTLKNKKRKIH
jgi:hypothetical protein